MLKGYQFGNFFLDVSSHTLYKNEKKLTMPERNIQLLILLAQASPQHISRQQLHEELWPDTVVSDWSLSRLVSDTRNALGEDGERPEFVQTFRGKGFFMQHVERVFETTKPNTKRRFSFLWVACSTLALFVLIIAWIAYYNHFKQQRLHAAISRISEYQDNAFTAFIAQAKRRNQLVETIEKRLKLDRKQQFELFFSSVYSQMNEEERFICAQMRAYSDTGIYKNNSAVLTELEENPAVYDAIPAASQLAQHLRIWINKYEHVFVKREDMCLVYVGVEDDVPYPKEVDKQIKDYIQRNTNR